jgi:hypothetical protein
MNGNLAPTPFRIECDRRQVIVRRDKPQATASRGSRRLFGFSNQSSRDVLTLLQREQHDNFALTSTHLIQEQPHRLASFLTHETRQVVGHVQDTSGDDSWGGEGLGHDSAHPRTVRLSYRSNLYAHRVPDAQRHVDGPR